MNFKLYDWRRPGPARSAGTMRVVSLGVAFIFGVGGRFLPAGARESCCHAPAPPST